MVVGHSVSSRGVSWIGQVGEFLDRHMVAKGRQVQGELHTVLLSRAVPSITTL